MAGLISGIVALFTSWLGLSGTVIGSVLSSFLYQFFSSYSAEKYEEHIEGQSTSKPKNIGSEIVYIFPLVVIASIELIFVFSALHYKFDMIFNILEAAVFNNLFRLMGIGLIALGIFPLLSRTDIDKINGYIVLVAGIFLLIRGMVDVSDFTMQLHNMFFAQFDFYLAIMVVLALAFVIVNVLRASASEYFNKEENDYVAVSDGFNDKAYSKPKRKSTARKIDTSFYNDEEHINDYSKELDDSSTEIINNEPVEDLPLYEEEIIYVNNPEDPDNPIKKRILKRIGPDSAYDDDYDETYIINESQKKF